MRMKLAEYVANRARRLGELRLAVEPQLAHGVNDSSLHGLEPIGNVRQRAVVDHVHRVIEIGSLGVCTQRHGFDVGGFEGHRVLVSESIVRVKASAVGRETALAKDAMNTSMWAWREPSMARDTFDSAVSLPTLDVVPRVNVSLLPPGCGRMLSTTGRELIERTVASHAMVAIPFGNRLAFACERALAPSAHGCACSVSEQSIPAPLC